ncbi:hypothetical protein D9758_015347 [Tetrapyrgos nigripes]|uniref:Uncharacterized protein n=1 Tax=Tetrapyrgos nigripes TaxID=182062 RepID=A0A8H5CM07_9AGAR|nr:hypothetical protein D9758_015347 [Tetrapyrgos nigripes]
MSLPTVNFSGYTVKWATGGLPTYVRYPTLASIGEADSVEGFEERPELIEATSAESPRSSQEGQNKLFLFVGLGIPRS